MMQYDYSLLTMQKKGANKCRVPAEELGIPDPVGQGHLTGTQKQLQTMALVGAAVSHQRLGIEQQPRLGIRSPHQPTTPKLYALPVPNPGCALTTVKEQEQ